jgi:hypothetical protein
VKNKKMIIISILAAFCAVVTGGIYYVNKTLLPTIVKEKIISGVSAVTGTKVTLENVRFNLFRGIIITNLTLFDRDNPEEKLCSIKEASATIFLLGFLKEKKIIIPGLKVNSLEINMIRKNDGSFNFAYIIDRLKTQPASSKMPAVLIKALRLTHSLVHFTDRTIETPWNADLRVPQLTINASWQKAMGQASGTIVKDNKTIEFQAKASYAYATGRLTADTNVKGADLMLFKEYLKNLPVALESGQCDTLEVAYVRDSKTCDIQALCGFSSLSLHKEDIVLKNAKGSATLLCQNPPGDFSKASYQGDVKLENADFASQTIIEAKGLIAASSCAYEINPGKNALSLNLNAAAINAQKNGIMIHDAILQTSAKINLSPFACEGTAQVKSPEISGLPQIGKLSDVSAKFQFKNDAIVIQELLTKILDTAVAAQGTLTGTLLELNIDGDFDLEKIAKCLPEDLDLPAFEISGTAETKARIKTDMAQQGPPAIDGETILKNVGLEFPENKIALETDIGRLKFDTAKENVEGHFEAVKYRGQNYSLDGNLKGFKTPSISAMIIGADAKLQIDLTKEENLLRVTSAKGSFRNSAFDLSGELDAHHDLRATGTATLACEDLTFFWPEGKNTLKQTDLKGTCSLSADITGPVSDFKLWRVKSKGSSDELSLYGLKLQNIQMDYVQIERQGFLNGLLFDAYGGKGAFKGKFDFAERGILYALQMLLNTIDLSKVKMDTPLKEKNYYGILDMKVSVQGTGSDLNSLKGGGSFTVKEGNLWEFNPLADLGSFIFKPGFNKISFTSGQADFTLQNGAVATDNLELFGPTLAIMAEGHVTFGGELNFLINTQVPQQGQPMDVISKAGSLTAIKVTGSVKDPKYKIQPIGENIMKKLGEMFSNITP